MAAPSPSGAAVMAELAALNATLAPLVEDPADEQTAGALRAVAACIARTRCEIAALAPSALAQRRIPSVGGELDAIRRDTTTAIEGIVAAVEELLGEPAGELDAYHAFVTGRAMAILEACCVDDITSQRVTKALDSLSVIERRMSAFSDAMGAGDEEQDGETALERRARENILHGPTIVKVAQAEIDELFEAPAPAH